MTKQELDLKRHIICCRKKRLHALLKEVREIRKELTKLESDYEEAENIFLFGTESKT